MSYSSTNFVVLGLALAALENSTSWEDYDQLAFLPADVRRGLRTAKKGRPRDYTEVHGYDRTIYNGGHAYPGQDVANVSGVFAGWSASDIVGSAGDVAAFGQAVYGQPSRVLPPTEAKVLVPGKMQFYGFATFNLQWYTGQKGAAGWVYGHLGATYGYQSVLAYSPALNLTVVIATSLESQNQQQPSAAFCAVYNTLKNHLTGSSTTCTVTPSSYFGSGCSCTDSETVIV
jgi:CubicO group peptidase (beta-lactamase class C family)